jgi:hypothetical protein
MESLNWKKISLAALLVVAGSTQATQTRLGQTHPGQVANNIVVGGSNYVNGDANGV